jgi:NOL1/NOP2/sun family putative RNA methylase
MAYKPSSELDTLIDKLLGSEKTLLYESIDKQLPHTIRFNTLKGKQDQLKSFLDEQGFRSEPFPGFTDIFRLEYQPFPIGKSLSHFLGHFYIQDMASMLPPRILDPGPGDLVLDMSAAPGSKTTQMAVMMDNRGMILANDIVQKRLRALINNLQRMGVVNTAVVKNYGESFGNQYFETFDKILLDPACSGLGTLHKNPEILSWWTPNHCIRLASSQRALITSAVRALKPGGILVYSTCTLTPEENEEIIDFALGEFPLDAEPFEIPGLITRPALTAFNGRTYDSRLHLARRLYPFENQTEGFFLTRLRKTGKMKIAASARQRKPVKLNYISDQKSPVKKYLDYFAEHFRIPRKAFEQFRYFIKKDITVVSADLARFVFRAPPVKTGITIGRTMTHIGKLTTEGIHLLGLHIRDHREDLEDIAILDDFVNRRDLPLEIEGRNQIAVYYRQLPIGYGLALEGRLKSQFPKAAWPFKLRNY